MKQSKAPVLSYQEFLSEQHVSLESFCEELVGSNRTRIQIKNEKRATQNMLRIVKAVMTLSQRKGFQGMSLRDLSQKTELSMGALYNYFSSKEELFEMVYLQGRQSVQRVMQNNARDSDPETRLNRSICAHLYMSEVLPQMFSFFFMEARNLPRRSQKNIIDLEKVTEGFFEQILQDGIKEKRFRIQQPALLSGAIKALLQDWYLKRFKFSGKKISVEQYAAFVIDLVSRSLE